MPANLTILRSATFIGKRFGLADGKITKRSETRFSRGDAIAAYAPDAETLRAIIEGLEHGENLCLGVMRDGRDTAKIVTTERYAKLKDRRNRIARTLDHFAHPDGPGWLVIDFDDAGMPDTVAQQLDALGGVEAALRHIWPEMDNAEMLVRASSSSGVYAEGIDPKASTGLHVYVLIRDPENSSAALDALHRRAWAEGLGWIRPSADGKALVRSIVDVAVGSPERLVFEAPPLLGEGVMRDVPPIRTQSGVAVRAPLDAPDIEALIEVEKDRMRPTLEAIKAKYIRQRGKVIAEKKKITVAQGEKIVRAYLAQDGGKIDVQGAMLVYDRSGALVTADALVASVKPGDQFGLPDPNEGPSYGRTTATLMWGKTYRAPIIVSHAHGAKTIYRLPVPPSKAVWELKRATLPDRKIATLVDVLSKVKGQDDLPKVLAVAAALSNKVPAVMGWPEVVAFIDDHLPEGVITAEWLYAIKDRVVASIKARRRAALASTRFTPAMLNEPWVDHQIVDELSPLDQIDGVTVIRAPMASGKTQRIGAPWIAAAKRQGREVMAIAHRISLVGELAQRLDMDAYNNKERRWTEPGEAETLAICLPSISLDRWSFCVPEYLFIDEIRQVLQFLGAPEYCRTKGGTARDIFDRLVELVRNAKGVLVADAGADDVVLRFLRMCRPIDVIRVIEMRNPADAGIHGAVVTGEHCADDLVWSAFHEAKRGGRIWFACEGSDKTLAVGHMLSKIPGKKVMVINADNKLDAEQKAFLADPDGMSRKYDAVVVSPVISSGISVEHRDKPHFTGGFALFSGGAIRPADAAQMLRRVRYLKEWTIGLTSLNRFGGCRVEDLLDGREAATRTEELFVKRTEFDELVLGFEAEAHNERGDFGAGLVWMLRAAGWKIIRTQKIGEGDVSSVQTYVRAEHDKAIIRASKWLAQAAGRWSEVRVAEAIDNARKTGPKARTRRRIEAWAIMDVIGLRELEQEDVDWWHDGGRAVAARYEDLVCRHEPIDVARVTLAHRALRLARRKHYVEILGDWNPLNPEAVLSDELARSMIDRIWPRRAEFAASGAVPENWGSMKSAPKNARSAVRSILSRCGLWLDRVRCTESHFEESKINGERKSGTRKQTTRPWKWINRHDNLAQMHKIHAQILDRHAQRQRALLVDAEQKQQANFSTLKAGLDAIEARKRADAAANEALKTLVRLVKSDENAPPIRIYAGVPPEFLPRGVSAQDLHAAFLRRGIPVDLVEA